MTGIMDTVEMPKLPENQKSFAGIPEAIFLVSKSSTDGHIYGHHNLQTLAETG